MPYLLASIGSVLTVIWYPCMRSVLTLKFGGRGHDGESDRRKRIAAAEVLRDLQEIAPLSSSRFCWLVANTDRERTLVCRLE